MGHDSILYIFFSPFFCSGSRVLSMGLTGPKRPILLVSDAMNMENQHIYKFYI